MVFKDQSYAIGFAKNNRLTGILRHFSEDNKLMNITHASTGFTFTINFSSIKPLGAGQNNQLFHDILRRMGQPCII